MSVSLLRLAHRNLRRNVRRTVITAIGIGIGTFVIVFARGLVNGLNDSIVRGVTETRLGDFQIHHQTYLEAAEALPLTRSFPLDDRLAEVVRADPRITDLAGRIQFSGLVSAGEITTLFFGLGIDAVGEYEICRFQKDNILEGSPLDPTRPNQVVIGKPLADALGVTLGSEITAIVTTRLGTLNGIDLSVGGIIEYKMPGPGSRVIQLSLPAAQRLLHMNNHVTEVIGNVAHLEDVGPISRALEARLAQATFPVPLVVHAWTELGPQFLQMMEEQEYVLSYVVITLYVTMISGIVNTMLMAVFERTREIGTMMAIGWRRRRILLIFLLESCALGILGSLVGTVCGWGVVQGFEWHGFPLPPLGQATRWFYIYPRIGVDYILWVMALATGCALVAAIYPAIRASRLRPHEALSDH